MERKYPHKRWSDLYKQRSEALIKESEAPASLVQRKNLQLTTQMGTLIARMVGRRVRAKLKNKAFSCHRTIENLTYPKDLREWKTHWGSQLLCTICLTPALFDCTSCRTCNSIAHRLCAAELYTMQQQGSIASSLSLSSASLLEEDEDSDDDDDGDAPRGVGGSTTELGLEASFEDSFAALGMDEYNCSSCLQSYQDDVEYYERLRVKLARDRRWILALRLICRRILGYVERARFKKLRRGLVAIQTAIRKRRAKRVFFYWRRSQMRIVIVDLLHLPPATVLKNDLVSLCVVDPIKAQQLFRFDKTAAAALEEGFLIPGMTSHMSLVLSLCRVEEHTANSIYVIQEQCQLSVRDIDNFLEKLSYRLPFGKRVWWLPTDARKDFPYQIRAVPSGGLVAATSAAGAERESREQKEGRERAQSPQAESKDGRSPTPAHNVKHSRPHTPAEAKAEKADRNDRSEKGERADKTDDYFLRVLYYPQNPISAVVFLLAGPPVDILRLPPVKDIHAHARNKPGAEDEAKKKLVTHDAGPAGRTTRWWLCMSNLRLFFFQAHGDVKPRFVSDIVDAAVGVDPAYTRGNVVQILHVDGRCWLLDLQSDRDAQQLEFAVKESQKAHRAQRGSIFLRTNDVRKRRMFGFGLEVC